MEMFNPLWKVSWQIWDKWQHTGQLYFTLHQFLLLGDPRSESYAAKDFVLIKNRLQDIELRAPTAAQVCTHLLSETDLHFCMQINRQFKNSKTPGVL